MSKLQELRALDAEIQRLTTLRDRLAGSPELKREMEFQDKLSQLFAEYGKTLKDAVKVLEPQHNAPRTRAERKLQTFKNPNTGEVVETRGGNNKTLKAWKAKWGNDAVKGWLQN